MATSPRRRVLLAPLLLALTAGAAAAADRVRVQLAPPGPPEGPEAREHFSPAPPDDEGEPGPEAGPEVGPRTPGDQHAGAGEEAETLTPAQRLDRLFEALAEEGVDGHSLLQRRIAEIWSESGSDSMDLLLARGREAMNGEEYEKAVEHLTALTELAPDFAEGWNARATAYFLEDEYWLAVVDIQRTLTLEPRHFGALSGLGVILERIGDEAGALRAFREALRLNPHLDNAREAVERLEPEVDGRDI